MHVSGLYSRQFGTKRALSKNVSFTLMGRFQNGLNIFYQGQQPCFKAYPSILNEKWHWSKSQSERSGQKSEDNLVMNKLQSIRKIVLSIHVFSEKPNVYLLLRKRSGTWRLKHPSYVSGSLRRCKFVLIDMAKKLLTAI